MTREGRIAALLLLPVVFGGLFSLFRFALETFDVPREEDYLRARKALEATGFEENRDAVAVLPPWSLRAHQHLRGLSPISGDGLFRRPLDRYARLFVLVEPDAERYTGPLLERLGPPTLEDDVGRVRVLGFDLGGPRVTYDFRERLERASVRLVRGGEVTPCDQPTRGGLRCRGRQAWQRVTREWHLVSENGDEVIWAHPPPRGEVLEISFSDVPLGDVLVVRAGHTRKGKDRARAPVRLAILVGGEEAGHLVVPPRFDFAAEEIDTSRFSGQRLDVVFRIDTDDNGSNHFAFDAYAARRGGGRG